MAVGNPAPTSRAKVGPDSTATARCDPSTSRATWWGSRPVSSSKPLVAQASRMSGVRSGCDLLQHRAESMARHDDQHIARTGQRRGEIRLDDERARKLACRQITLVARLAAIASNCAAVTAPQARRACRCARIGWRARSPMSPRRAP